MTMYLAPERQSSSFAQVGVRLIGFFYDAFDLIRLQLWIAFVKQEFQHPGSILCRLIVYKIGVVMVNCGFFWEVIAACRDKLNSPKSIRSSIQVF